MKHIHAFVKSSLHLDMSVVRPMPSSGWQIVSTRVSRCSEEFTRRAVNSSHIRRDPVGVKSGCPGGRSRAPQGPPETYGRLPLWRVGCGESCGGRTGSDVARTAHGGVPRHKRPIEPSLLVRARGFSGVLSSSPLRIPHLVLIACRQEAATRSLMGPSGKELSPMGGTLLSWSYYSVRHLPRCCPRSVTLGSPRPPTAHSSPCPPNSRA